MVTENQTEASFSRIIEKSSMRTDHPDDSSSDSSHGWHGCCSPVGSRHLVASPRCAAKAKASNLPSDPPAQGTGRSRLRVSAGPRAVTSFEPKVQVERINRALVLLFACLCPRLLEIEVLV